MKRFVTGGVLASLFLFAGVTKASTLAPAPSPCDVVGTPFLTLTQPITEPDSGTQGDWAKDAFTENVNIWVGTDHTTFCASGSTTNGTFVTTGPKSPEAGASLLAGITGTFTGGETWVFPAGTATTTSAATLTLPADNSSADSQFSNWQSQVFSQTAGASTYAFTYIADGDATNTWTNADPISNPTNGNSGDIINPSSALSAVYVDGVNGNDTTNIGSQAAPLKTLGAALSAVADGGTINLLSDITLTAEFDIARPVKIDGGNHTIKASFNSASVIQIWNGGNNVTLKNLVEDASGTTGNRGINIFKVTGITLDNVTAENNAKNGIVVNGSTVTVNNITTANNGAVWGGIDVDLGSGVTSPASLTVNGVSHHTEANADIKIDDVTKNVSVSDTNNQYVFTNTGNLRNYKLKTVVTPSAPQVVVTSPTQPVSVTIDPGTTNATINFDSLVTNGTGTLPATTINSATTDVVIPASTVVTSTDTSWNGVIVAPTVVSAPTITAGVGQTATAVSAIEIGAGDTPLTFSKAVKLTFAGEAGNLIGWSQAGVFHAIATDCSADSQAAGDALADGADCRIDAGADLVVWTKHFTTFVTYTQSPAVTQNISVRPSQSRGGGGAVLAQASAAPVGEVLGAFTGPLGTNIDSPAVIVIKTQLVALIKQLISLLQGQLAAAITAGRY